jgi:monofunctional biosynthetic peptidoglycan transglycosylase
MDAAGLRRCSSTAGGAKPALAAPGRAAAPAQVRGTFAGAGAEPAAHGCGPRVRLTAGKLLASAGAAVAAFHVALWVLVALASLLLVRVNPPVSSLMLGRRFHGGPPIRRLEFVPLAALPRYARLMFVLLEDNTFYEHPGVELRALREAWRVNRALGYVYRGGSTIPMQLARTLFLTQNRTYLRKYAEVWAALEMDQLLSKRRILELYLNSIEFGPGVYGIGAAARYHFGKSAAKLDRDEFRRLAVIVASPLRYNTRDFQRRRALAERYAYLVAAFPDPGAPPAEVPPPPRPLPEEERSGAGVEAGVVVPEGQGREALPQGRQPGQNP